MKVVRGMCSAAMCHVKDVDIDPKGVFKYILVKVTVPVKGDKLDDKTIVRGYAACPFHTDINKKLTAELEKLKCGKFIEDFGSTVLGGGNIKHDPESKSIKVFGESQGYGKADHKIAADILRKKFPKYNVSVPDEKPC